MDSPNYQWPTGTEYKEGDKGTGAWAVKFGQDAVPESVVVTEGFEDASLDVTITDGGNLPWFRDMAQAHTGSWGFRAGAITHNQTSDAIVTVPGGTHVRFWYWVQSETNFDFFRVIIGGNTVLQVSGTVGWTQATLPLSGATSVTFRYLKDSSASSGADTTFIDDLEFLVPAQPAIPLEYAPLKMTDDGERLKVEATVSGTVTVAQPAGTITNGAETAVGAAAVQVIAANSSRKKLIVQNTGQGDVRVGVSGVTATTGLRLVKNGSVIFDMPNCPTQAIFAIRDGAVSSTVLAQEVT